MRVESDGNHRARASRVVGRRSVLRAAAGAVGSGILLSGAAGARNEYETRLDVVEDLGADPTGEEPINDALAEAVDEHDSVKVLFPSGTYHVENGPGGNGFARWDFGDGEEGERVGDVALVGRGDVTLRPEEGGRYPLLTLWGRSLRIEGFRIDQTGHHTSAGLTTVAEQALLVRDVYVDGVADGPYEPVDTPAEVDVRDPAALIPGVLDEDGTGLIEDFRAPDGVEPYGRKLGCWVNFLHAGDLLFSRCEFSKFSDNGIYGSPPGAAHGNDGSVRVENCYFRSNNVTAIRLGSPGSYAKNCTVVFREGEIPVLPWGGLTGRAGWVWYGFDGFYENVDVVSDHPRGMGIYTHWSHTGTLDVKNCRFELDADGTDALRALDPGGTVTVENVSVTGEAGADAVAATMQVANRAVEFSNLCLSQSGEGRDGIALSNATATVENSLIDVPGEPLVVTDSDVTTKNLRDHGNCPPAASRNPLERE